MASSLTTLDDAELLRRTAGDPDAFLVVRDRWAPTLEGWLRRRTDGEAHAADVLAETFAQAFQHAGRFRDEADGSAGPWLFGIAANVLRQSWRRTERERRTQRRLRRHDPAAAPAAEDGVAARLDAAATAADLRAALAALPPEQRQAVQLRVIEELPYEEVAGRLACSNDAARLRVSRGLRRMRLLLLVVLTFALLVAVAAATGLLPAVRDVVLGDAQHVRAVDERGEPLLTVRCSGRDGGHRICRTIPGDGPPVIQQAARLRAAGARAAVVESARLCVRGRCREVVAPRVAPPAAPGLLTLHRSSLSLAGPAPRAGRFRGTRSSGVTHLTLPGSATIACPPAGGPRPCRRLRTTLAAQPPRPLAELADALGVRWAILETATACSLRVGLRCRGIPLAAARRESLRTHVRGPAPSSIGYGVIAVRAAP